MKVKIYFINNNTVLYENKEVTNYNMLLKILYEKSYNSFTEIQGVFYNLKQIVKIVEVLNNEYIQEIQEKESQEIEECNIPEQLGKFNGSRKRKTSK